MPVTNEFWKTQPKAPPGAPQGFRLKIYDAKGNPSTYDVTGQKRSEAELLEGKEPSFCDKYAFERCRKILSKNRKRVKTAIIIHKQSNEIIIKYIAKQGYLLPETIKKLHFIRISKWNLNQLSYIERPTHPLDERQNTGTD